MFEDLIENEEFISDNWFLTHDTSKLSDEEVKELHREIIHHNKILYKKLLNEINSFNVEKNNKKKITNEEINNNVINIINDDDDDDEVDYSFYINKLESYPNVGNIIDYLPKKNNPDFNLIINNLITYLLKDIKEANDLAASATKEELLEWKSYIKEKQDLINKIIEYRDNIIDDDETEDNTRNNIFYLQSSSNNYYALQDISIIDVDYYDSFNELLNSIIDGTFKNIKAFINNKKLSGLLEVKNPKTRIIFRQIDLHNYVVLAMFIKKCNSDAQYRDYLTNRQLMFNANEEYIKNNINNEDYIKENENITNHLLKTFNEKRYK